MWHPWRVAGERYPHINVVCSHQLPRRIRGLFDGATIWLCSTLTQAERRSALTHELQHAARGLAPLPYRAREERIVDELAARTLVPLPGLIEALRWTRDTRELAEELWTDVHTVTTRMATLDPLEVAELEHHLEDQWLWIP